MNCLTLVVKGWLRSENDATPSKTDQTAEEWAMTIYLEKVIRLFYSITLKLVAAADAKVICEISPQSSFDME